MPRAVRFDEYGPVNVLRIAAVERPRPTADQVVVEVVAAGINPGEIMIREGAMAETAPAQFPSGQGSDLAGRIAAVGADVTDWGAGDEVIGWTDERAAQAEYVAIPATQVTRRPAGVPWDQAGSLYVAGGTAHALTQALGDVRGQTVVFAGATGGVGSVAVQLLVHAGARVLGVAGADNDEWLRSVGVEPVNYGDDLADRLRAAAPDGVDALFDAFGGGYVQLGVDLGVSPERIATIIDFDAAGKIGAQVVWGYKLTSADVLAELAGLIDAGDLTVPIAATYDLADVREAYTQLADRHTRGKIVLHPAS